MSVIITFMFEPAKLQMNCASASGTSTRRNEPAGRPAATRSVISRQLLRGGHSSDGLAESRGRYERKIIGVACPHNMTAPGGPAPHTLWVRPRAPVGLGPAMEIALT